MWGSSLTVWEELMSQLPSLLAVLPGNGLWFILHKKEGESDSFANVHQEKMDVRRQEILGCQSLPIGFFLTVANPWPIEVQGCTGAQITPLPHTKSCLHCDEKDLRERRRRDILGWRCMLGYWNRKVTRTVAENPHCHWRNYLSWAVILLCSQDQGWKDRWWLGLIGVENAHVKLVKWHYELLEEEFLWRMEIYKNFKKTRRKEERENSLCGTQWVTKVKDPVVGSHTGGSEHMVKVRWIVGNCDNPRFTKRLHKMFSFFVCLVGILSGHKP